jgi:hypothetical protein
VPFVGFVCEELAELGAGVRGQGAG